MLAQPEKIQDLANSDTGVSDEKRSALPPIPDSPTVRQLIKVLNAIPGNSAFRYMEQGKWQRWAKKLLDFYGGLDEAGKNEVAAYICLEYFDTLGHLSKPHWLAEILWDFAENSKHYDQTPDLMRRIIDFYQHYLEEKAFYGLVVRAVLNSSVIPPEFKQTYDHRPRVPSQAIEDRLHNINEDAQLERKLLVGKELPESIDVMASMLKKMRKNKMGLPDFADFFVLIKNKFGQHEDWPDIEHELKRLKKHHKEWHATQMRLLEAAQTHP